LRIAERNGHPRATALGARIASEATPAERERAFRLAAAWTAKPSKNFADPPTVHFVQYALSQLGYDPGEIDGYAGPATASALLAYRRKAGLPLVSNVTLALVKRLRADLVPASYQVESEPAATVFDG
jgi:peptidoglycan hydrolase-like protein with peptidoglycan-binding domain